MAGETRRHMVKVGALAAWGTCTRASKWGNRGGPEEQPPANGSGTRMRSRHRARCEWAVTRGAHRGFVPRRTKGWACVSGSHVPAPLISSCRVPVKAGGLPACALCPAPQTIRGSMVLFGRGCAPKAEWLLPPTRLSPEMVAALGLGGAIRGAARPRASAEAFPEKQQQKPAAC